MGSLVLTTTARNTKEVINIMSEVVTVNILDELLADLVNWQKFALQLPGVKIADTQIVDADQKNVEGKKIAIYSKWLKLYPNATWNDVIKALEVVGENNLAKKVREYVKTPKLIPESNPEPILEPSHENIDFIN